MNRSREIAIRKESMGNVVMRPLLSFKKKQSFLKISGVSAYLLALFMSSMAVF